MTDFGNGKSVKLMFWGDVFLGSNAASLDPAIIRSMRSCDHVITNLESPICEDSPVAASKILLRSQPGSEKTLKKLGVTAVTLANNHIFDHGDEGFKATCKSLSEQQIPYTGAGMGSPQASKPLILESNGLRVGIIACTEAGTEARIAVEHSSGCHPLDFPDIESQIAALKNDVDFVIVTPHWGFCDYAYPPLEVVRSGERVLDSGADLVIGHHSHVVQGFRKRPNGQAICYSLGDFAFGEYMAYGGRKVSSKNESAKGLVVCVELSVGRPPRLQFEFTIFKDNKVCLDTNRAARQAELEKRSAPLVSLADYPRYWRKVVRKRFLKRMLYWLHPRSWRKLNGSTIRALGIMIHQQLKK
jgi:hypothetical protein